MASSPRDSSPPWLQSAERRAPVAAGEERLLSLLDHGDPQPAEVERLRPAFPWRLQIQTTSFCQAACVTCPWPETRSTQEQGRMEEGMFRTLLDQCRGREIRRVGLYLQNEPLLDPRLPAWTALAREALPEAVLHLYTNGWLLTPDSAAALEEAGLDEIHVSLLAADPVLVERYAPGTPLPAILHTLDLLAAERRSEQGGRLRLRIAVLDLPGAVASLAPWAERWKDAGFALDLAPVGNRAGAVGRPRPGRRLPVPCHLPFTKACILWNGQVLLCASDWRRQGVVGDLRHQSLEEIWNGAVLQRYRERLLAGHPEPGAPCFRCDHPLRRWQALYGGSGLAV